MISDISPFQHAYIFFIVDDNPAKGLTTCAAELIDARDDLEAREIAAAAFAFCDDAFHSYGLIHRSRILVGTPGYDGQLPRLDVIKVHGRCAQKICELVSLLAEDYPILLRSSKFRQELQRRRLKNH